MTTANDEHTVPVEERMEKAVNVFRHALTGIRTGRANPGLVDTLRVEVKDSPAKGTSTNVARLMSDS